MGWFFDDLHEHEGYLIGLLEEGESSGLFRELTLRRDGEVGDAIALRYVCVGCDCGWRSPRMFAPRGTEWTPCHVWLAHGQPDEIVEGYEETARKMWRAHAESMRENGAPLLRIDQDGYLEALRRRSA